MIERINRKNINSPIKTGEITAPQVGYILASLQELSAPYPYGVTYATYREIRKDPTVALARAAVIATALASQWSTEADDSVDDTIVAHIDAVSATIRKTALQQIVEGVIDYGWISCEKIFEKQKNLITLKQLKPLYHDMTVILVHEDNGDIAGIRQTHPTGYEINLDTTKCIVISRAVEGTNWYGQSLLENVRKTCIAHDDVQKGAAIYDQKIAGSHWVIYYPPGISLVNGSEVDNGSVAIDLLTALEFSGSITVPQTIAEFANELNKENSGWRIECIEDSSGGKQPTFVARCDYLDKLKVRGLLLPERAILEGQHGTNAEADTHQDIFLTNIQQMIESIVDQINMQLINQIICLNYGTEYIDKVKIVAAPLVDQQIRYLRTVYSNIMANPVFAAEEIMTIDTDSIKDSLGIPKLSTVANI